MSGQPPLFRRSEPPPNRLLAALTPEVSAQIAPQLEPVSLERYQVLYDVNASIRYIWFPETAVVSWVALGSEGEIMEVATIGNEGFVGVPSFLGVNTIPGRWIVQIGGSALSMRATAFRELTRPPGPLRELLGCYTQFLFNQMAQTALCNRIHAIDERCARWLLMTHDRVVGDQFFLTHEFLAQMLGVRRSGVSVAAGILQQAGLIRYHRGTITIVDREGLEAAACECYAIVRATFDELLGAE